ncbi:MAG: PAQR family membrane homeostasis protein TrhA [Neisseriaceae bacterium]
MRIIDKPSKYSKEYLMKLFQYTLGEDIANAITHTVGAFFGLYALINLTWIAARYGNWLDSLAFIFYGLTILFAFVMSSIYHSMVNHTARSIFKKMDHISIYWLIFGTYTPYVFSLLKTKESYIIYSIVFSLAAIGTIFKSLYAGKFKIISTIVYVMMGWAIIWVLPQIIHSISPLGLWFMAIGGFSYTIGAILYAFGRFRYSHMVWHIFVILGVLFQFISVNFFILQHR